MNWCFCVLKTLVTVTLNSFLYLVIHIFNFVESVKCAVYGMVVTSNCFVLKLISDSAEVRLMMSLLCS